MPLSSVPVGTIVHNVELKPGKGGQIARSAGSYAQLIGKDLSYSILRLMSGEVRFVLSSCLCTIGAVSNQDNQNTNLGKAGRNRWLGKRPTVRGVAMNPVDHPMGGGRDDFRWKASSYSMGENLLKDIEQEIKELIN